MTSIILLKQTKTVRKKKFHHVLCVYLHFSEHCKRKQGIMHVEAPTDM